VGSPCDRFRHRVAVLHTVREQLRATSRRRLARQTSAPTRPDRPHAPMSAASLSGSRRPRPVRVDLTGGLDNRHEDCGWCTNTGLDQRPDLGISGIYPTPPDVAVDRTWRTSVGLRIRRGTRWPLGRQPRALCANYPLKRRRVRSASCAGLGSVRGGVAPRTARSPGTRRAAGNGRSAPARMR
jgi:hypothetical protein